MNSNLKSFIKYAAFFAVGLFLFWLAFRGQNINEIIDKAESANYWWALVSIVFGVLSNISRSIRWNMLIEPAGYKPRIFNTFSAVVIGYFANLAVPRLGEVSRCAVLNQNEKIPVNVLLGTVVTERIVDVISLFIILLLCLALQLKLLSDFAMNNFFHPLGAKILGLAEKGISFYIILFIVVLVLVIVGRMLIKKLKTTKFYERFLKLLLGFADGLRTIGKLKNPLLFLGHSIIIWFLYAVSAYFCFMCFDFTSPLGFTAALTAMAFGGLGFVVPVQGGIGAYHFIVTQTMMLYGLTYEEGLTFATVCHASQTVMVIIFGILFFFLLPIINRKNKTDVSH